MKITNTTLVSVISLLIFFGCFEGDIEKAKIKFGMEKYEKQSERCDSTGCAKILLEYPEIKSSFNSEVKDSLDNYILNALLDNYSQQMGQKSIDEMAKIFLNDYDDARNEFSDYAIPWEINNTISIIYNTNSIVSFQSKFYHYTGGAHGNSGVYFANFDSRVGKILVLSDLLISGYEKELNNVAEEIFRKDKELSQEANLEEEGYWFEGNKFSLNDNFGIKSDGLVFFFNSYEIAPYAMGPTELIIPYKAIKNLVKKDGLLNNVVSQLD